MEIETKDLSDKNEIRKQVVARRIAMSSDEACQLSLQICRNVMALNAYKEADTVLGYMSIRNEVDLMYLFEAALGEGKKVYIPKSYSDRIMRFYQYDGNVKKGIYGISEPADTGEEKMFRIDTISRKKDEKNVLMLEPGVAYDIARNRLGYGGGYYDTFLSERCGGAADAPCTPQLTAVGIAYDFQVFDKLPVESHDVKVDMIVTEKRVLC